VCDGEPGIVDALHLPLTSPLGALHRTATACRRSDMGALDGKIAIVTATSRGVA